MEKLVLASGIILTCLATVAFNPGKEKDAINAAKINAVPEQIIAQNSIIATGAESNNSKLLERHSGYIDTIPKKQTSADGYNMNFKGDIDGKRVELKEEHSKIKELYIDGKKIPEEQYAQYQPMIEKIHTQFREQASKLQLQSDTLALQSQRLQEQAEAMEMDSQKMQEQSEIANDDMLRQKALKALIEQKEVQMQQQAERMQKNDSAMSIRSQKMQQDLMRKEKELLKKQLELQEKIEELQLRQEKLELLRKDSVKVTGSVYTKPVISAASAITVKPTVSATSTVNPEPVAVAGTAATVNSKASVSSAISVNSNVSVKPVKVVAVASALPLAGTGSLISNSTTDDIINDLEKANIISNRDNLSIKLTNDVLIVNGVKQPEEIHQEILKKHVAKPGDKISLRYSNHKQ